MIEERIFYCQIDTYFGVKDYLRNGKCVRLTGVSATDFNRLINQKADDGVDTLTIDIDYWYFWKNKFRCSRWIDVAMRHKLIESEENNLSNKIVWHKLEIEPAEYSATYMYQTFSTEDPTFVNIKNIEELPFESTPDLKTINLTSHQKTQNTLQTIDFLSSLRSEENLPYSFDCFHVGQGMCSLVHNQQIGILLDVGAGIPISRLKYLKTRIQNDLVRRIKPLRELYLVLSHLDYDHWKLLAWDKSIRNKVKFIYIPDKVSHLALRDKAILNQCVGIKNLTFKLGNNTSLEIFRSDPSCPDSNGECLVSVFNLNKFKILAPGDYVYKRFITDKSPEINELAKLKYKGVVVPHHGDLASAKSIFNHSGESPVAFFSAGTHKSYKHPTKLSRKNHKQKGYLEILDNTQSNIIKKTII